MLAVLACIPPIAIEILESYYTFPSKTTFLTVAILYQAIILPPVVSGTIVVAAVFFWHASVVVWFVLAALLTVPACLLFLALVSVIENASGQLFTKAFFASMFGLIIGAGSVAVTIQIWNRRTLTHLRRSCDPIASLGTRALFELTGLTAISYAIIIGLGNDPQLTGGSFLVAMVLFSVFGGLLSCAGIGMFRAFLRDQKIQFRNGLIPGLLVLQPH